MRATGAIYTYPNHLTLPTVGWRCQPYLPTILPTNSSWLTTPTMTIPADAWLIAGTLHGSSRYAGTLQSPTRSSRTISSATDRRFFNILIKILNNIVHKCWKMNMRRDYFNWCSIPTNYLSSFCSFTPCCYLATYECARVVIYVSSKLR